jgi:hypothetical protein
VFSTIKRLSQQREQIDKQDKHNILRSATWSIAYRHEGGATRGFQACIRCGASEFDGWAGRATAGRCATQSPCHIAAGLDWREFQRFLKDADGAKCRRVADEYSTGSRAATNTCSIRVALYRALRFGKGVFAHAVI